MKTNKKHITKSFLAIIVSIVSTIATMGAASASLVNAYQPKVPQKLQK